MVLANRGLDTRGWDTLLVHGTVDRGEREIDLSDVHLRRRRVPTLVRPIRPLSDVAAFASLARIIRRFRPDIVHSHLSKAGLLARSASALTTSAPTVHTFHGTVFGGYFGERSSAAIVRAEQYLGHRTSRIVALSDRQEQELVEYGITTPDRIRIVPLGLELSRFVGGSRDQARRALGIADDVVLVVAIGRLVPIKRLDRLLRAFGAAASRCPALRLSIMGDGPERESLVAAAGGIGIDGVVSFAGWTTDTPRWYAAADIVVLTSDREGTPLALIEAAAAGRPVVAVDVGGVADVVEDGVTGFVVARDDEAAFADRLERLAGDRALRESMGAAAPTRAGRYDADRLVDDLDALYRELL